MTKSHERGKFIYKINDAQKAVYKIEDFYTNCSWIIIAVMMILFIIAIILLKFGNSVVPSICGFLFLLLGHIGITKGWCHSVRKFLASVVLTNLYAVFLIGVALANGNVFKGIPDKIIILMLLGIYFAIWMLLSLIAEREVAKIANEIVSVLFTIIFTAGTYVISMKFNDVTPMDVLRNTYQTEQQLEFAIAQQPQLESHIIKSAGYYYLEQVFLLALPFLCVSLFCTLEVDLKEYWLKKNNYEEFWTAIERKKQEQLSKDTGKETE